MPTNLLALLQSAASGSFADAAARAIGEGPATTQSGLTALLPAILGSVAQQGSTAQGATSLLSTLSSSAIDSGFASNAASLLGSSSATESILAQGTTLARGLFGGQLGAVGDAVASMTGMRSASAPKLIALAMPAVFGFLKRHIAQNNLDPVGVRNLLADQSGYVQDKLDPRLASAAGLPVPATAPRAPSVPAYTEARNRNLWPLFALAAALLLGFLLLRRPHTTTEAAAPPVGADTQVSTSAAEIAPPAPTATFPVSVHFDVGSSTISGGDSQALGALAQAIKGAGTQIDITGYTDPSGDHAANVKLAKDRAVAVRDALVAQGVPMALITMKPPADVVAGGSADDARRVEITESH